MSVENGKIKKVVYDSAIPVENDIQAVRDKLAAKSDNFNAYEYMLYIIFIFKPENSTKSYTAEKVKADDVLRNVFGLKTGDLEYNRFMGMATTGYMVHAMIETVGGNHIDIYLPVANTNLSQKVGEYYEGDYFKGIGTEHPPRLDVQELDLMNCEHASLGVFDFGETIAYTITVGEVDK